MKYMRFIFSIILFAYGSSLGARSDQKISFSGEWLYMLPSIDQPYFAIDRVQVGPVEFEEKRFRNEQDWHSGYRIELFYSCSEWSPTWDFRWTQFPQFSESKLVSGETIIPVIAIPAAEFPELFNSISIKDQFDFYYADLLFGIPVFSCCPVDFSIQGGIQYGVLELKEQLKYVRDEEEIVRDHFVSCIQGIGPEIGCVLDYQLSSCLSLVGKTYASFLISKRIASRERSVTEDGMLTGFGDLKNESYWGFTPTINIWIGWEFCRLVNCRNCACDVNFRLGYEVIAFFNAVNRIFFTSISPPESGSVDQLMNFMLHGPSISFGVGF